MSSNIVLLNSFPNIPISSPWSTNHAHACQQQDIFLFYTTVLFHLLSNTCISDIWNIYNLDENFSLAYQTMCYHMFSYTKADHTFHVFQLQNWLILFLFLYVQIFHLLWRQEGVGIYCKFIPNWIKSMPARILFPVQYRTKFEILLGELFQK